MSLRSDLLSALRFTAADTARISNALFARKVDVYDRTFRELADRHDLDEPVVLSSAIRRDLSDEARQSAEDIVGSYNRALRDQLDKLDVDAAPRLALLQLEEWARRRGEVSARVTAVTETYGPHLDAQVAFYRNAAVEPLYDFGGHGDAAPACDVCKALRAGSPWPMEAVRAIGNPHPQCRQSWHIEQPPVLPVGYRPGQGGTAGIVGSRTLVQRAGSIAAAVRAVEAL